LYVVNLVERRKILIIILVLAMVPVLVFSAAFVAGGFFLVFDGDSCPQGASGFAAEDVRVQDFEAMDGDLHL
jgi:hypothetical protein